VVVAIPRDSIRDVYFGSQRGGSENPWIKIGYMTAAGEQGARFADASPPAATGELQPAVRRAGEARDTTAAVTIARRDES
jgi:hypothetical protein